jgi:argininosuccinate lyase
LERRAFLVFKMAQQPAKLWGGVGLHPLVEAYTVGEDYRIDSEYMLPYDLKASEAHAEGLCNIKVLAADELKTIKTALKEIGELWKKGEFKVSRDQEDGHTAIEQYITEKYGDVGKKIHTGRSRNDQSMTMIRLFTVDKLREVKKMALELSAALQAKAKAHENTPMPGYTHMQKAMPATVALWLRSFASGLSDCAHPLEAAEKVLNQSPLGSAAGFGINGLKLDREATARIMGFDRVQENPMYCGMSRGMFENVALQAMTLPMVLSSRFAVDMMMFTQQETGFFALPDGFVTGSSIMPQKKNYDLFEIMRCNGKVFGSLQLQVQETIVGLGSGYHRDLQQTKKAFVEACEVCTSTLRLLLEAVPQLVVKEETLKAAMTEELFVTDKAYEKVAAGKPFREAYLEAKDEFFSKRRKVA